MSRSKNSGTSAPGLRLLRVGENVRHAISAILTRGDIQDDQLKGVSVTVSEARVSPDLRNATLFIMPLGGDPDSVVVKALNRHAAYIRGEMSKLVTMKYMPRLKFTLDGSFDEATHINELLRNPKVARDVAAVQDDEGEEA